MNIHKNFLFLFVFAMAFIACSSNKTPSYITKYIRDTIIVNTVTERYEAARIAKPNKYTVSTKHYPAFGQDERIRFLILHYTAMENESSIRVLTQKEVSSHYLVNDKDDDSIFVLVDETKRAWHAGVSKWKGIDNINFSSIGIEIVNKGYIEDIAMPDGKLFLDYPDYQFKKVAELTKEIVERYGIEPVNVIGHSDIAPQRKHDPGPKFPWKRLYDEYKIGAWFDIQDYNLFFPQYDYYLYDTLPFITQVQKDLETYGYPIEITGMWDEQTKKVIIAFQYHFRPRDYSGLMDAESWAILKALNKKYRSK